MFLFALICFIVYYTIGLFTPGASFTNSLRQRKPSFAVKIVLSDFTKDRQWRSSAERRGQLFLHLTLLNMHFKEFPFQTQNLWEESIQINHATHFTNVCARQITGICAIRGRSGLMDRESDL